MYARNRDIEITSASDHFFLSDNPGEFVTVRYRKKCCGKVTEIKFRSDGTGSARAVVKTCNCKRDAGSPFHAILNDERVDWMRKEEVRDAMVNWTTPHADAFLNALRDAGFVFVKSVQWSKSAAPMAKVTWGLRRLGETQKEKES